ncbi:MAG: TolC family protein [candidate division Zixibacteria bacterium]|nr:TolC family protein [candidate division Zixibacteria bacterium]
MTKMFHPVQLRSSGLAVALTGIVVILCVAASVSSQTALTIQDVRRLALEHNRTFLSAREDVNIARSEITKAWSDALPDVSLSGGYNRNFTVPKVFFIANGETMELQTGFKNSFGTRVSVSQPIWHGGKVFTALNIAKRYEAYSEAIADQVEDGVILNAEQLFYATALARAQLEVWDKALEANTANLEVVEKQFNQGMVSEYELLRARVERQNVLPEKIAAEAEVHLSEKRLLSFLGIELDEPVTVIEDLGDTSLANLPALPDLIAQALAGRPEMIQAQHLVEISAKAIKVARADYWPSFDAVGAYDWQSASDSWTMTENESSSWTAGITVSLELFNGGRTKGYVSQRKAEHNQARLNLQQTRDNVRLEVEEAYTALLQAKKSLDIQGTTIASAEEGHKIAQLRFESGVGTQLEVLSAQSALIRARTARAAALYGFRIARAKLRQATNIDL